MADITLQRVGNLPTYIAFKKAGNSKVADTIFLLIAVGWKGADIDFYVVFDSFASALLVWYT